MNPASVFEVAALVEGDVGGGVAGVVGTVANAVANFIDPQWAAPANVGALCSTRWGGVSEVPFNNLNLGDHVGDAPAAVNTNRARLAQALGAKPVFLRQTHGVTVMRLQQNSAQDSGQALALEPVLEREADACWTTAPGLACTIMVADCLPVLLARADGLVVGAAHCGWRGLANGVLEALIRVMRGEALAPGADANTWYAWLGPCIGPQAFEVGNVVKQAFEAQAQEASTCFAPLSEGKWLADLPGLARQRLRALGVTHIDGNNGSPAWCTHTNAEQFFSYRRDGRTGRMAASVWRKA